MDTLINVLLGIEIVLMVISVSLLFYYSKPVLVRIFSKKLTKEEFISFFKVVCKFYGLEMAEEGQKADAKHIRLTFRKGLSEKDGAAGLFILQKFEVQFDADFVKNYPAKRVCQIIVHELTHAWCMSVAPEMNYKLAVLTQRHNLYWDSSNPIEETARVAERGIDVRAAWMAIVNNDAVIEATKNGTCGFMGATYAALKASSTKLPTEILAKIR